MVRAEKIEAIKYRVKLGLIKILGLHLILVFDEFGAYYEMNDRLAYDDPTKASYETAMSNLREIVMLGRPGFILIGMQRPDAGSLPMQYVTNWICINMAANTWMKNGASQWKQLRPCHHI